MQMTIKHYEKTVLLNGRYYEEPKKEAWSARKKLPSKESVRKMHSRTNGALWGIWGSPQTSKNRAVFLSGENRPVSERVPHGIACNSLVSFCSQLCFDRCRFVINKNFSKNNSSFPVRQKGSSATVL